MQFIFVSIISKIYFLIYEHELEGYRLQSEEIVGTGRMMDYIFMSFPLTDCFVYFSPDYGKLAVAISCFRPLKEFKILL